MKSNRWILFTIEMLILLPVILLTGCSGESASLSPDGVAMVNGKEISKSDLADTIKIAQRRYNEYLVAQGKPNDYTEPGSPEYSKMENEWVDWLVKEKVWEAEAENMGLNVSESEIDARIDIQKQKYISEDAFNQSLTIDNITLDQIKGWARKMLIMNKVWAEVTKNDTDKTADKTFQDWYAGASSKYDIVYADQYKPTATTTTATTSTTATTVTQ